MQQVFAISGLINCIISIIICLFVIIKKRTLSNIIFSLLAFVTAWWSFGYWRWLSEYQSYDSAIFWLRFLTIGSIWIPILFAHWISLLLKKHIVKRINNFILTISYFSGLVFTLSVFTPLMVKSVESKLGFIFWPNAGSLYIYYILFAYVTLSVYYGILLVKYYKRTEGYLKNQIKYVALGTLIALMGGFFNFFLWYDIMIPPFGNFLVPIYFVLLTYAIIKYRLMDIRLVITRSILYFILVVVVAMSFTFITFTTGQFFQGRGEIWVTLIVSLIIVIGLDPLRKFLARITDKFFYKGKVEHQEILRSIGQVLARELDLENILHQVARGLEKEVKLKKVTVLVNLNGREKYLSHNAETLALNNDDLLINYLKENRQLVITEELARRRADVKIKEQAEEFDRLEKRLDELGTALAVPIISEDALTGVFLIQNKLSGSPFTQEDLDFFEILAPQVATALEKSKLFEEVQAAKINLEKLVEQRTRDLKERNRYLQSLQNLISIITRSLDFQKVMQTIADGIHKELGMIGGILSFIDQSKENIYIGAISDTPPIREAIAMLPQDPKKYAVSLNHRENICVRAINNREILAGDKFRDFVTPAIPAELADKIQEHLEIKSILAVPVYSEEEVIGAIDFTLKKEADKITEVEREMMKSLADQVGIVYRNLTLYNRIQKVNEQLQQANVRLKRLDEAKSEFLSIASHQLRTPLTGIKGYLSMIMEGDFGSVQPRILKVVEDVFENTDRMTRLVNVFLNVSRIESGKFELSKKDYDLLEIIGEVIKDLSLSAEKKKLELIFHRPKKVLPAVSLDRDKIKDVLVNLIDNAIKYTPKGKVEIFVEQEGRAVKVVIKDTGIGIRKGEAKELFKKFVRGEGVAQVDTGGSGLGLFIAKKITEAHNGKIWAESAGRDMGSSFTFTLPME